MVDSQVVFFFFCVDEVSQLYEFDDDKNGEQKWENKSLNAGDKKLIPPRNIPKWDHVHNN